MNETVLTKAATVETATSVVTAAPNAAYFWQRAAGSAGCAEDPVGLALFKSILTAPVYAVAQRSPLTPAPQLSARLRNAVQLKREDLQPVFSFKLRGAYNKLARLSAEELARGVLAVSAGNHAQGVALAAQHLGAQALIVMPVTTPAIKVDAVKRLGAQVLLHGDNYDQAAAHGRALAAQRDLVFVHPFDDPDVIAGQGTVAMELLMQAPVRPHAVFIPVGGGGLAAGMALYLKSLDPSILVIGVEPDDAACLKAALEAGFPCPLSQVGLFVDGCAVRQIGSHNFDILRDRIDAVITVDVDQICAAIKDVFEETRSIVEPAGALALAGLKRWVSETGVCDQALVAVLSGANMNFDRLRHVAERADLGEASEAVFGVTIPERRGSFLGFCRALGKRVITEFNYRCAGPGAAQVFVGVALKYGQAERLEVAAVLRGAGYEVADYTEDELAKLHVRYMVGGHSPQALRERVLRFEFPERPGALLQFLETLGTRWNISLFHYRNHGAAFGRVLAGFEIPAGFDHEFDADVKLLDFETIEVTGHPALGQFLS
jgi:threonine dehydratase